MTERESILAADLRAVRIAIDAVDWMARDDVSPISFDEYAGVVEGLREMRDKLQKAVDAAMDAGGKRKATRGTIDVR